jgi:DNA repair exonuclease SbcCD ATPase subunit
MAKATVKDPAELLKEIEEEQNVLFKEFEEKMRVQREKKLSALIEPKKTRRTELAQLVNKYNTEIAEIDKELAKLTGTKPKAERKQSSSGRYRLTDEDKEKMPDLIGAHFKKIGKFAEVSRKDLIGLLGEKYKNHVNALIELWNAKKDFQIVSNGKPKAAGRLVVTGMK